MGSEPPKPKVPQKTLKEQVQENVKQIGKMRRQFQRQVYKLESNDKKMNKDLKKLIQKKNGTMVQKKQLAQNILKNQKFIKKYQAMDGQLQNVQFELQQMGTMEQMQNVMNGMAKIMGDAKNKFKTEDFMKSMKTYTTEKERMEMISQMVQDSMEFDDQVEDADADALIRDMQVGVKKKQQQKMAMQEEALDEDV